MAKINPVKYKNYKKITNCNKLFIHYNCPSLKINLEWNDVAKFQNKLIYALKIKHVMNEMFKT